MQWKINKRVFCENRQVLFDSKSRVELESKVSEVLSYFCRNPDRIISRDELIDEVWDGQIVTDNAVTSIIAKLRKALNEETQANNVIVTHPKKGYRFVGEVLTTEQTQTDSEKRTNFGFLLLIFFIVVVFSVTYLIIGQTDKKGSSFQVSVEAITRGAGSELQGSISPNGKWLAFSATDRGSLRLFIKDMLSGQVDVLENDDGFSGPVDWSKDGKRLVYLYTTEEQCEFRILEFNNGLPSSRREVYQCSIGSYGKVLFDHTGNGLFFAERINNAHPYYLYHINIDNGDKLKLVQPTAYFAGHREFDLHPNENKLLLSTPTAEQNIAFFELNWDNNSLHHLFTKDGYLCCAIYTHSGKNMLVLDGDPAFQLTSMSLDGSERSPLFHSTQSITAPQRGSNHRSYLYSGENKQVDILFYPFNNAEVERLPMNSSVLDFLPKVSPNSRYLAFISTRTGKPQVWLTSGNHTTATKVSHFEKNHQFYDMAWSPSGKEIALLSFNSIFLLDLETGEARRIDSPQNEMRGLSWKNDNTLSFSQFHRSAWRVYNYHLQTNQLDISEADFSFIFYGKKDQTITLYQDGKAKYNEKELSITLPLPDIKNRKFAFDLIEDSLFYIFEEETEASLIRLDVKTGQSSQVLTTLHSKEVTVGKHGFYITGPPATSKDLYRVKALHGDSEGTH